MIYMKKYNVGDVVTGTITGVESYGIFVKIDDYYSGMVHISEISDKFVSDIESNYLIGDTIKAKIIDIIDEKKSQHIIIEKNDNKTMEKQNQNIEKEQTDPLFRTLY